MRRLSITLAVVALAACSSTTTTTRTASSPPISSPSPSSTPTASTAATNAPSAVAAPAVVDAVPLPTSLPRGTTPFALVSAGRSLSGITPGEPTLWTLPSARAALDGSAVAAVAPTATGTEVAVYDTATGTQLSRWTMAQRDFDVAVVAPGGRTVALVSATSAHTDVAVLREGRPEPKMLALRGRVEPEAFSTNAEYLFALGYETDGRYRVQSIELTTGERYDTGGRWKGAPIEDMSGTPVRAVLNGDLLSTLYRDETNKAHPAFVHTLNLTAAWSHCADLPPPFGTGASANDSITGSLDHRSVYVASNGSYATIDVDAVHHPANAENDDDVAIAISTTAPVSPAALSPGGALLVGKGIVAVHDGSVTFDGRSTPVPAGSLLVAVRR